MAPKLRLPESIVDDPARDSPVFNDVSHFQQGYPRNIPKRDEAQSTREQQESAYRDIVSKYKNNHDILAAFNQNLAQRTLQIQTMSTKNDDCPSMQTELTEVLEKLLEKAGEWSFEFEKSFVRWSIEEVMNRRGADTDLLEEMIWGYHHTRFGHLPVYEVRDGEIVEILNFRYPLAENQDDLDG